MQTLFQSESSSKGGRNQIREYVRLFRLGGSDSQRLAERDPPV